MKSRLNLTIETRLLEDVKRHAIKQKISINDLVVSHFNSITKPKKKKNILDLVEQLDKPNIAADLNLKDQYYKEK